MFSFTACGGGGGGAGGGAGGASIPADEYTTHNPGGWGGEGGTIGGTAAGGGVGGVTVQGGTTLVVTGYIYNGQTYHDVSSLTRALKNANASGQFSIMFTVAGETEPRTARITKTTDGYKLEHQYKATCVANGTTSYIFYYIADGINLVPLTTSGITGWRCSSNNQLYGTFISGVKGDLTLTAEFAGFIATANKTVLYGGSSTAGDNTATITITNAEVTPTRASTSSSRLTNSAAVQDPANPTTYTMTVNINGTDMFGDNTPANLVLTDGTNTTTVSFVLKNKYTIEFAYSDLNAGISNQWESSTQFNAGTAFDFSTVPTASLIPAGRSVVAYEDLTTNTIYKLTTTTPDTLTFGDSLGRRHIVLQAVINFTYSRSDGGYETTASPLSSQTGTSTNPYLLNYYGNNVERQIEIEIKDHTCYAGQLTLEPELPAIVNIMFDITHTANKFLIKIKPTLAANSVYTSDTIKLTVTDPMTGAKKDVYLLVKKNKIGTKEAPDAVGDIVFNDGSAMTYAEFSNLGVAERDEKKAAAIALIFYKGTSSSDALGARTLGVGLKQQKLAWCTNSADAYNMNITTIQCNVSGIGDAETFTGDIDGSDNFEQLASFPGVNDSDTAANYPAFYFAKNYKDIVTNLVGTPYETGWYLPSIAELFQIYKNGKGTGKIFDIGTVCTALDGDNFVSTYYWSSSEYDGDINYAYQFGFNTGDNDVDSKRLDYNGWDYLVRCIRVFP